MNSNVYVYVKLKINEPEILAGKLIFTDEKVQFSYSKTWLNFSGNFPFHPELLPLSNQTFYSKSLDGALSLFKDSGPGIWGRAVIKRMHPNASQADFMMLSNNLLRIGIFRFSDSMSMKFENDVTKNSISLDEINLSIAKMESGIPLTPLESILIEQGSSMDGMRPKSFISLDNASWIAKFPSKNDLDNKAFNEAIGMRLAKACGIPTPDTQLQRLENRKIVLAVKRFDIGKNGVIFPMMSVASLMGFSASEDCKKDYRIIAQALSKFSCNPKNDCISLFKRMCLNIMISNRDDHIFNHAVIGNIKNNTISWQLSPVFDVVCGEGSARGHALQIGEAGFSGTLANAISSAHHFGISQHTAENIIKDMLNIVRDWKYVAKTLECECGYSLENEVNDLSWAILNKDIFKGYEDEYKNTLTFC